MGGIGGQKVRQGTHDPKMGPGLGDRSKKGPVLGPALWPWSSLCPGNSLRKERGFLTPVVVEAKWGTERLGRLMAQEPNNIYDRLITEGACFIAFGTIDIKGPFNDEGMYGYYYSH